MTDRDLRRVWVSTHTSFLQAPRPHKIPVATCPYRKSHLDTLCQPWGIRGANEQIARNLCRSRSNVRYSVPFEKIERTEPTPVRSRPERASSRPVSEPKAYAAIPVLLKTEEVCGRVHLEILRHHFDPNFQ